MILHYKWSHKILWTMRARTFHRILTTPCNAYASISRKVGVFFQLIFMYNFSSLVEKTISQCNWKNTDPTISKSDKFNSEISIFRELVNYFDLGIILTILSLSTTMTSGLMVSSKRGIWNIQISWLMRPWWLFLSCGDTDSWQLQIYTYYRGTDRDENLFQHESACIFSV